MVVHATLYVERDSQKGIVIGRAGSVLKQIGAEARPELELLLGARVFLDLRVKLSKEWQRDARKLERLGY
jgi:GTP-binding protein Era